MKLPPNSTVTLHDIANALHRHGEHDACRAMHHYIKELDNARPKFHVCAGKIEQDELGQTERNYKYVDSFDDYTHAVDAFDTCEGYHFRELTMVLSGVTHTLKD